MLTSLIDRVIEHCQPLSADHGVKVLTRNQFRNPQPRTVAIGYLGEQRGEQVKEGLRSRLVSLEAEVLVIQPDGKGQGRMLAVIDALIPLLEGFYPFDGYDHLRYLGTNPDFSDSGVIVHVVAFQALCPVVYDLPED